MNCKRTAEASKNLQKSGSNIRFKTSNQSEAKREAGTMSPKSVQFSRKTSGLSSLSFDRDDVTAEDTKSIKRKRNIKSTLKRKGAVPAKRFDCDPKTVAMVADLLGKIRREHESVSDLNLVVERLVTKYRDQ